MDMSRISELTLDELIDYENDWWERQDDENLTWVNEGINLFRRLLRLDRAQSGYETTLAYLYLKQGEDLKLQKRAYESALRIFERVVRLDPTNALACYRLGFLQFYQEAWGLSIHYFQQAITHIPVAKRNCLTDEQRVKAYHYLLKATQNITKSSLQEIQQFPEEKLNVFGEIKLLIEEIKEGYLLDEEKPYQMIENGVDISNITERNYRLLSDPEENMETFIFNFQGIENTTVSWMGKQVKIYDSRVSLLEYLMRHPEGITLEDYLHRVSDLSRIPSNTFAQNIRRLRLQLQELDPVYTFIESIEGGYRWNGPKGYRMFKHTNDVTSEMLLD
jgi:tetratricopeptide (TPR) repeat protein